MCGIAGFLSPRRPADESGARAMAYRIAHRGPDAEVVRLDERMQRSLFAITVSLER